MNVKSKTAKKKGKSDQTLFPAVFTRNDVLRITGWTENEYTERRTDYRNILISRWKNSSEMNNENLQAFLSSNMAILGDDNEWFDEACEKYHETTGDRHEKRLRWYVRWGMSIKGGGSRWYNQGVSGPGELDDPIKRDATRSSQAKDHAPNAQDDAPNTPDEIIEVLKPRNTCARPSKPKTHNDQYMYPWDSAYLHIKMPDNTEPKTISLGKLVPTKGLIPTEEELNCHYLKYNHNDLLRILRDVGVTLEHELNFSLVYEVDGQKFNLFHPEGYACALGAFSHQERALPHRFQPMIVTYAPNSPLVHDSFTKYRKRGAPPLDEGEGGVQEDSHYGDVEI